MVEFFRQHQLLNTLIDNLKYFIYQQATDYMFTNKKAILLLYMVLFSVAGFAQQVTLQGRVTDSSTEVPIVGASLVVRGTEQATQTNENGEFTLQLTGTNVSVEVSYVGYETQTVATGTARFMEIRLVSMEQGLEEVVVTGYQTERKKDLTGAVHIADVDEMKKQTVANPMKALQGQVPGMLVTGNGAPSSPTTIRIRGIGTLNNNDPLYIIDGVPTKAGMHELNQADIESIQVLKDASSASIYGSRAANGVI